MREILFRGIVRQSDYAERVGKWIYGNLIRDRNFATKEFIYNIHDTESSPTMYELVEPETVGQYTGLQDKNGTRIFEGDILLFKDPLRDFAYPNRDYTCQVVWQDNAAMFDGKGYVKYRDGREMKQKIDHMLPPNLFHFDGVVIGNIHDNPELLEEEK